MNFEYRVVPIGAGQQMPPEQVEDQLNKMGASGWELVSVLSREKTRPCLLFKKASDGG